MRRVAHPSAWRKGVVRRGAERYTSGVKKILYANAELLTGDDIARAVLLYSETLGTSGSAETIEIPILEADGSRGTALLLVGPASQIVAEDAGTEFEELEDQDAVEELNTKTHRLKRGSATDSFRSEHIDWADEI
jgi:hypothetical protein